MRAVMQSGTPDRLAGAATFSGDWVRGAHFAGSHVFSRPLIDSGRRRRWSNWILIRLERILMNQIQINLFHQVSQRSKLVGDILHRCQAGF